MTKNLIISLVFGLLVLGGVFGVFALSGSYLELQGSENWPQAEGLIKTSHVETSISRRPNRYSPRVSYVYTVSGQTYTGTEIAFKLLAMRSEQEARQFLTAYPVGSVVKVYYKPAKPSVALLRPGIQGGDYSLFAAPVIFALFGVFGLVFFLLRARKTA